MATFATDTFGGTGNLDAHSPDTGGGTWTKWFGDTLTVGGGVTGADGAEGDYYNSTTPGNADQTLTYDLVVTSNVNYAGGLLRFVDANNYYGAGYDNGNGWWELFKVVSGSFTRIGHSTATLTVSSTYAVEFSAISTTLTVKVGGSTVIGPSTDSGVSSTGHVGLYSASNRGVNGYQLDNWVAADSTGGGTNYTKSLSGGITPSGTVVKQTNRALAGGVTPAGAVAKRLARALAGGMTPAGTLATIRVLLRSYSGGITPAGALAKQPRKALAGAVTPTGAITRSLARSFAGALTPAGAVLKQLARALAGALAPSGTVSSQTVVILPDAPARLAVTVDPVSWLGAQAAGTTLVATSVDAQTGLVAQTAMTASVDWTIVAQTGVTATVDAQARCDAWASELAHVTAP